MRRSFLLRIGIVSLEADFVSQPNFLHRTMITVEAADNMVGCDDVHSKDIRLKGETVHLRIYYSPPNG